MFKQVFVPAAEPAEANTRDTGLLQNTCVNFDTVLKLFF